jgi:hypothetical protein
MLLPKQTEVPHFRTHATVLHKFFSAMWSRGRRSPEMVGRRLRNLRAEHLINQTNQMGPVTAHGRDPRPNGDPGVGLLPLIPA